MDSTTRQVVVGVFEDPNRAQQALEELKREGFVDEQIGYAVRGGERPEGPAGTVRSDRADADYDTEGEKGGTREGLAMGAVSGGALGAIVGAAAALLIPGIGPVIAGGILGAALTGAAVGAATGGLVGALREWGLPEEEANYYQGEFEAGRIIVTVKADDPLRQQTALSILRRNGAYDATSRY